MKKNYTFWVSLFLLICFTACDSNKKLKQENAEKAIKEFVSANPFEGSGAFGQRGTFDVTAITAIAPVSQFSESEASSNVTFNYRDTYSGTDLILKFTFKKNVDKHWILTSVDGVAGIGSQSMSSKIKQWQQTNIMTQ